MTKTENGVITIHCDMTKDCKSDVTHIEDSGFIYCLNHAQIRKAHRERCRKLTKSELKQLQAGNPLTRY